MSRLTDLISQAKAKDPELGKELEREFKTLAARRSFGLNFERHRPESVELPGRPVSKGDKVRVIPPRGETKKGDQRLWMVCNLSGKSHDRLATVELIGSAEPQKQDVSAADLVVVAEFDNKQNMHVSRLDRLQSIARSQIGCRRLSGIIVQKTLGVAALSQTRAKSLYSGIL